MVGIVKRAPHDRAPLSNAEAELWQAWRTATDSVTSLVARDINAATGLSGADHDVLTQLAELGRGRLRQQDLADALGWHKSRLSHHLSRMAQRALIKRQPTAPNVVLVSTTARGRQALRASLPVQAQAVRAHLVARLSRVQREQLVALLALIATSTFKRASVPSRAPARPAPGRKEATAVARAARRSERSK